MRTFRRRPNHCAAMARPRVPSLSSRARTSRPRTSCPIPAVTARIGQCREVRGLQAKRAPLSAGRVAPCQRVRPRSLTNRGQIQTPMGAPASAGSLPRPARQFCARSLVPAGRHVRHRRTFTVFPISRAQVPFAAAQPRARGRRNRPYAARRFARCSAAVLSPRTPSEGGLVVFAVQTADGGCVRRRFREDHDVEPNRG